MINVLDKHVADKIAAGEVIERPVSIVKELVENSIDAGADAITVEIRNGGKTYIRVTDNGCGIPKAEAETAFLRHATSKISTVQDLSAIETLGFRGEALASIAAVTHTEMITKTAAERSGVRLLLHGGECIACEPTGCPDGTTIIVTDLFYNTPARAKFLKSASAESGRIIALLSQIALAYSRIRFRLVNNGSILFSTSGNGDILAAILAVYRLKEYEDLVPLHYDDGKIRISGYISKPSLSRTNRRDQIFFVNGRVVESRVLERGITGGYRERLFEGRFPVVFLFLNTSPEDLDVNIHPNKREIRFEEEGEIIEAVTTAVRNSLGTETAVIQARDVFRERFSEEEKADQKKQQQVDIKQILQIKRSKKTDFVRENSCISTYSQDKENRPGDMKKLNRQDPPETAAEKSLAKDAASEPSGRGESAQIRPVLQIEAPALVPFDFDRLQLTGSIFDTYITAVDDDHFYLIDQHAAHERVFYEKLVGEYMADEKLCQPILTPLLIDISPQLREEEEEWLAPLLDMGFSAEPFGSDSCIVREIPTFMTISEAEDFLHTYLDHAAEGIRLHNTVVIGKLITRSCKAAVKAHDHLSRQEAESLLEQLKTCRNPFSCPHGRPTFIRLSRYEIERMFKRT